VSITRAAIERSRVTVVFVLIVVFAGYFAYKNAPRAEDPGFPIRVALIKTFFPGASAERVEQLVSDKIEKAIQQMPELDKVNSTNKTGVSLVFVNLKESYKAHELRRIWDSMRRKVDQARAELPNGVVGPFINDEFGDVFGIVIGLTGDGLEYRELKDVADEVRDELLRIPDVAKVDIFGAQEERVYIEYDNIKLAEKGVSPAQLQSILASQNIVISGGQIRVQDERYSLEPSGNFVGVKDIEETLLQLPDGPVIPLKDVVETVSLDYVDPASQHFQMGGVPGLALAISMRDGGNLITLGTQIRALTNKLVADYPIGVELEVLNFQPDDVSKLVDNFVDNLLQAVVIVILSMVLLLGLRTGLVVASLIPTAVAAAMLAMSLFGIGLDQMSLASLIIALGLLVDNAIVMAESIMVQIAAGKDRVEAAVNSAKELRVPLLTSSLTTCAAFLPIFLAKSATGEYTAPLFKVVTITLLCSWALSITLTPLLCVLFLKVKKVEGNPFDGRLYRYYRKGLLLLLRRPAVTMLFVVGGFFGGLQLFKLVPNLFFPPSDKPTLTVSLDMPTGTAIEQTQAAARSLEKFIQRELKVSDERAKGVTRYGTYVGQGGPRFYLGYNATQATPSHASMLIHATDRPTAVDAAKRIRGFIRDEIPDARATAEPLALGPSSKAPIMIELSGDDTDTLFGYVDDVKAKLASIKGTNNIRDDWGARTKKLSVTVDQQRARRAGISSQDIAISLQTAFMGFRVTEYREDNKVIPVMLRSIAADREDLGKVENLSVYAMASGRSVPLKQVADVDIAWEASLVKRKNRTRTVTVMTNLDPGVTAMSVVKTLSPWLTSQKNDQWLGGYDYHLGGEMENSTKANKSIGEQLPIAGFIIIMLLVWQFNSIRRPLIICLTVPMGVVGVAIGLVVFRSYVGFMTLLGIISLSGIVINNAIVLLDRIKIEIEELGHHPADAVLRSTQQRLRPILLTTATTILGLIPLWYGGGPMWEPLAIAIIVGLAFATLLTLGVVPVLYSLLFRVKYDAYDAPA
jgi:multidrug efflux pump